LPGGVPWAAVAVGGFAGALVAVGARGTVGGGAAAVGLGAAVALVVLIGASPAVPVATAVRVPLTWVVGVAVALVPPGPHALRRSRQQSKPVAQPQWARCR
jgi:hypothetical protein